MTLGHIIIGQDQWCLAFCRNHEQAHVRQAERWGAAFIPAYLLASALAWFQGGITISTIGSSEMPGGLVARKRRMPGGSDINPSAVPNSNPYTPPSGAVREQGVGSVEEELRNSFGPAEVRRARAIYGISWIGMFLLLLWIPVAMGSLGVFAIVAVLKLGFNTSPVNVPASMPTSVAGLGALAFIHVSLATIFFATTLGLRRLRSWARWMAVAMAALFAIVLCVGFVINEKSPGMLVAFGLGALLVATVLYVLLTPPSKVVFSKEYRHILEQVRRGQN
jgi:hypothetical protein